MHEHARLLEVVIGKLKWDMELSYLSGRKGKLVNRNIAEIGNPTKQDLIHKINVSLK